MEKILDLLKSLRPDSDFLSSTDFIEDNLLDSLDIINIVIKLEEIFNIKIKSEEIERKNFVSIEALKQLVEKSGGPF